MTVSKRLRFEILKRDNHQCRYCGGRAPDVVLTIDHVVPVSLGGSDAPTNLATACRDCNAGKTSSNPDSPLVDTVADDALRWAQAMRQAADEIAGQDTGIEDTLERVAKAWKPYYKPADWASSVVTFVKAGLSEADLLAMVKVAYGKQGIGNNRWAYFCGCCWSRVRQMQDRAAEIVSMAPSDELGMRLETRWTQAELDEYLDGTVEWLSDNLGRPITRADLTCEHGADCRDILCQVCCAAYLSAALREREVANG